MGIDAPQQALSALAEAAAERSERRAQLEQERGARLKAEQQLRAQGAAAQGAPPPGLLGCWDRVGVCRFPGFSAARMLGPGAAGRWAR